MLKVMSLPVGQDGCSGYRIRLPLKGIESLQRKQEGEGKYTHILDQSKDDMMAIMHSLPEIDVMLCRPGSEKGVQRFKDITEIKMKAKWVLDIDDNYDEISPYSQFYKEYGLKEFKHNGMDVWKNGNSGFGVLSNLSRRSYLEWMLHEADMVTVTTRHLADWAYKFNKNVHINNNTIDFSMWWKITNQNQRLKVVWQGSPSHYEDWYTIKEPLNKLMREFDFDLYMVGSNYMGIFDEDNRKNVIPLPWVPFDAHSYRMMALQPDIALIPLADMPFNWYKSSIKWYEMSAMGVPSVVSNVIPYADDISKKNSIPFNNSKEFYDGFKSLLTNPELRSKIGNEAYNWVHRNANLEIESVKYLSRLEELCKSH